jgi:hypothetical protein
MRLSACGVALLSLASAARAEVTLAVYTGTSRTHSSDMRIQQPATGTNAEFHGVTWDARPFHPAPYYGIRLTWFPSRIARLGGGIDFTHYKMYADTNRMIEVRGAWNGVPINAVVPMRSLVNSFEISHGVNLTSLNIVYRWAADRKTGRPYLWQPYVGAGVAMYLPHAEGTINGVGASANYRRAGEGYQLFAGAEYRPLSHLGIFADTKFDNGSLDIDLAPGIRAQTRTRTFHALAGLAWHF